MIWRILFALACGYLLFVAYRFYAHSQPVTAIDIRQSYIEQTDTLELAVVWPEGPDKEGYVKAARLVVDAMNEEGLGGCPSMELQVSEDQGSQHCKNKKLVMKSYIEATGEQNEAVVQARDIAANPGTLAVLGYYRSDVAVPAATVYEHKGVLMLSSGATNVKFTNYDFRHIFRLSANDKSNAEIMAKHIYDEGYINVYILYERGLYGTDFSNYFIEYATAMGLRIPGQAFYEERENDFLPLLSSLRSTISPINLTDEVALLQAKLQQTKRIEQIRQLSAAATKDASIIQFLATEQQHKKTSNKFFDSMPRVKLLYYLEQELAQSASSAYLQMLFQRNQDELSLMSSAAQYAQLDLLVLEIRQWMAELKLINDSMILPKEQAKSLMNQRIVTRKAIDFDSDDTSSKLNQMLNRIARIKSGEVDAIFMAGFMPEAAQVILQARSLNLNLPIFGGHPFIDLNNHCKRLNNCASYGEVYALVTHDFKEYRQVYEAMHHEAQEYKSCHPKGDKCLPERYSCDHFETAYVKFQNFSAAYQKKYGQLPDNWAVQGFLATSIIQETIKAAHTFDPEVLADTLLHQGNSEFTDKGLMFSCNSLGITEGDVLVEGMKIRKLEDLQESN